MRYLIRFQNTIVLLLALLVAVQTPLKAANVDVISSVQSLGQEDTFWVGITFQLFHEEKVLGDPVAPKITLKDSNNIDSFQLYYPESKEDKSQGVPIQAFDETFTIPVKIKVKIPGQSIRFAGHVDYVICSHACIPGQTDFDLKLKAGPMLKTSQAPSIAKAYQKITEKQTHSFVQFALLAILGGMILNLMPCVLPVLGLKFLSVMSSKKYRMPRLGFFATILGIFTSFWALAGLSVFLKNLGQHVGWGMHFQEPLFLIVMVITMLVFSLNLLGAFEIHLPSWVNRFIDRLSPKSDNHLLSSYVSGVFATLLATPCTAPFLGVSVGFALTQGAGNIFLMFTFIALGFSVPYWILLMLPARWIPHPKPGAWMMWLKGTMGALLLLTAVWLSTVLYTQLSAQSSFTQSTSDLWKPFEPEKIDALVKKGKTVVVNVTAGWCLTCKVNERHFREGKDLYSALGAENVYAMKADWTSRDEVIASFLESHDRSGIPFTVIYGPAAPEGIVLPEILTHQVVVEGLSQAGH